MLNDVVQIPEGYARIAPDLDHREPLDPSVSIHQRVAVVSDHQISTLRPLQERADIVPVIQIIAVAHHEVLVGQRAASQEFVPGLPERVGGAESFLLIRILNLQPAPPAHGKERAVIVHNPLPLPPHHEYDLSEAGAVAFSERCVQERFGPHRHKALLGIFGQMLHPRSKPCCEDHRPAQPIVDTFRV